ncbi:MAG: ABC transporter permease, partial [Clostridia bacterium]|nr:ABC transporter permease [Clostridia bacterium]
PIGYFKDAWIRFRKNKASIVAAIIIILIVLFSFLTPIFTTKFDAQFMCNVYSKKGPRNLTLSKIGIADGTMKRDFSEKSYIKALAIGIGAENYDGKNPGLTTGINSYYQPIRRLNRVTQQTDPATNQPKDYFDANIDTYLEVGFIYTSIEQSEYQKILDWEKETGLHVFYPLVADNEYNMDPEDANLWYKSKKYTPVKVVGEGKTKNIAYSDDMVLEDNYVRDAEGNLVYYKYAGGGTVDTAMYRVRVLYYNYYIYQYGFEPEYLLGTDSQGYDMSLRLANGVRLSILVAIFVSLINFIIGAVYGAVEGYYGGAVDLTLERVSDILAGVPFIVVATLFQIHLAAKLGAIPCLLFAFVVTGWIGTASRVRTQFYRFKNQEYVMAARTLGAKDSRIILKHIFPNSLGTLITSSVLVIPGVIFDESMLSFLGIVKLGGSGTTSLGTLLSDASGIWTDYPHLMIFPALIISLLMISFNLFGNGLRDAFNPSLRGVEE